MSIGEMAYLTMVITAFCTFISVVGFISTWSRRPSTKQDRYSQAAVLPAKPRDTSADRMETVIDRAA